jgi:hypothetical protein
LRFGPVRENLLVGRTIFGAFDQRDSATLRAECSVTTDTSARRETLRDGAFTMTAEAALARFESLCADPTQPLTADDVALVTDAFNLAVRRAPAILHRLNAYQLAVVLRFAAPDVRVLVQDRLDVLKHAH